MRQHKLFMLVALLSMVFACQSLQMGDVPDFNAKANAINDQAILDYNRSQITIFQRDDIRKLLCDFQTQHNHRVEQGVSPEALQADFNELVEQVNIIYNLPR